MISQPTDALVLHTSPQKRVAQLSSMYLYTYSSFSPKCCPSPIRAACLQRTRTTNSSRSETYSFWCQMLHVFILLMQPMCGTVNNDHTANDEDNKNDNNNLCIFFSGKATLCALRLFHNLFILEINLPVLQVDVVSVTCSLSNEWVVSVTCYTLLSSLSLSTVIMNRLYHAGAVLSEQDHSLDSLVCNIVCI